MPIYGTAWFLFDCMCPDLQESDNDAFLEINIFVLVSFMYLNVCSVVISILYIANSFQVKG